MIPAMYFMASSLRRNHFICKSLGICGLPVQACCVYHCLSYNANYGWNENKVKLKYR